MLPKASRIPHAMTQHGDTHVDNYYWLRDDTARSQKCWIICNKKMRMAVRLWPRSRLLQDRVLKEIIDRIPPQDASAPM